MQLDERYGNPIFVIDFTKIAKNNFKADSIFTAEQILGDLQKFVKKHFFILQEVPGRFLGEYQKIWTKETISISKTLKKDNLCFADEIFLEIGEISKENALKKIRTILSFAFSKQGTIERIHFVSPEYDMKVRYFFNSLWFHSPGAIESKHFWKSDIQICDEIFVTYKPLSSNKPNALFWEVVILNKLWDSSLFHKIRFYSRDFALELICHKFSNPSFFCQDEKAMEMVNYIQKLKDTNL
jgi:hypothetical protein